MTTEPPTGRTTAESVWRAIRTPLTLICLLAILGFGAKWSYDTATAPPPPPPPTPCVEQPTTDGYLEVEQVSVSIFNGGTQRGLAGDVAHTMRERGFEVLLEANTTEPVGDTVVVGAAEKNPEVQLVLKQFKGATFRADGRIKRDVDVLVGDKYAGVNAKAPNRIAVKTKSVCIAPLPSPDQFAG